MVLRIAGLLHLIENPKPLSRPISADTLLRAVKIMRPAIEHARIGHGFMYGAGGHDQAKDILAAVQRLGPRVSRTDLNQALRYRTAFQKAASLEAPLALLEEYRWIKRVRQEAEDKGKHPGGRPTETIFLNLLNNPLETPTTRHKIPKGRVVGVVGGYSGERERTNITPLSPGPLDPTGTHGIWSMDL